MTTITAESPAAARGFLESVELTPPGLSPFALEGLEGAALPKPPEYEVGVDQTVTVGSQIAEFAAGVPAELRPQIANAFLLAQLAANRRIKDGGGGTKDWYDTYVGVLANTGWLVESDATSERAVSGSSARVHKEIIPVLTAVLGPAVAATALVLTVLQGLERMDKDQPWITLFDRESQRASANQFQISYTDVGDDGKPRIGLACFELDASRSVTQVLFFRFSDSGAKLRHFSSKLSLNEAVFEAVNDVLQQKVAQYVTGYIADIEI